jgi:hypothetical protein
MKLPLPPRGRGKGGTSRWLIQPALPHPHPLSQGERGDIPPSCATSPCRSIAATATACRSPSCPRTAPSRSARRNTKSATSPWKSRSGKPTCAPSAASACSSARIRPSARGSSPLELAADAPPTFKHVPARARIFRRHPHQLPGGAGGLHRLRRLRRGLPDPRQVQRQPPCRQHGAAAAVARAGARQLRLLPEPAGVRPRRTEAHHHSRLGPARSRCSNTPAPAPAAARRPTSVWRLSCSATAC